VSAQILTFMHGAITLACFLIGLKFLKFWRSSKDRFFLWLSSAFFVFTTGWIIRAFASASSDHAHYVFVPRLVAFLLIIAGVLDKNRRGREPLV
jgi:hypothetical protein